MNRRLLYFSPATSGGLADYAREQANALVRLGIEIDLFSSDNFLKGEKDLYKVRPLLFTKGKDQVRFIRRIASANQILQHYWQLARVVEADGYSHVLLGAYAEYLAPLWSGPLLRQAARGVIFGAIVHDPVRDYVVGPLWWHRRSIASAYSFLREAFVHESIVLDTVRPTPRLRTTVLPQGVYTFPLATTCREDIRRDLGISEAAQVWLSFGHIRDGKNLDLAIRALAHFPEAFLLVAGKEQSGGQKSVAHYRALAQQQGVSHRCLWLNRFIAPEEVGNLFAASDLILLNYSKDFRSASAVLNVAVHFRKPVLASSGQGNLQTMVSKYDLGTWVEPDQLEALIEGLSRWQTTPPVPRWEAYALDNSWHRNAEIVSDRMFE